MPHGTHSLCTLQQQNSKLEVEDDAPEHQPLFALRGTLSEAKSSAERQFELNKNHYTKEGTFRNYGDGGGRLEHSAFRLDGECSTMGPLVDLLITMQNYESRAGCGAPEAVAHIERKLRIATEKDEENRRRDSIGLSMDVESERRTELQQSVQIKTTD